MNPRDDEVRRVHLEHEAGVRADRGARSRRGWCGSSCRPRAAGRRWTASRSGRRKPSPISTSSPAADHDLPAGGERGRGQHQRGGAVVDHVHGLGGGHRGGAARRARPGRAGPAGRWPRSSSTSVVPGRRRDAPRRAAADSGARPRLVCSTTPVALSTGRRRPPWPAARRGRRRRRPAGRPRRRRTRCCTPLDGGLDQAAAEPRPPAAASRGSASSASVRGTRRRGSALIAHAA